MGLPRSVAVTRSMYSPGGTPVIRAAHCGVMSATAAAAFEDSGATSIAGVLTSGDPSVMLQQGSLLMELSGNRSAQTRQLLTDASQLAGVEQEMSRTEAGIAGLKRQLASHRSSLGKLIDTQKATLASLTVPQRQAVTDNAIGANGSSAPQQYTGPTSTQVSSPLNLRSCGSPPRIEPSPTLAPTIPTRPAA